MTIWAYKNIAKKIHTLEHEILKLDYIKNSLKYIHHNHSFRNASHSSLIRINSTVFNTKRKSPPSFTFMSFITMILVFSHSLTVNLSEDSYDVLVPFTDWVLQRLQKWFKNRGSFKHQFSYGPFIWSLKSFHNSKHSSMLSILITCMYSISTSTWNNKITTSTFRTYFVCCMKHFINGIDWFGFTIIFSSTSWSIYFIYSMDFMLICLLVLTYSIIVWVNPSFSKFALFSIMNCTSKSFDALHNFL